ncbi:MAG: hypothetical protein AABY68_02665 [Pseudomonadota bacterium]
MSSLLLALIAVVNIAVFKWQELSVLAICILATTLALAAADPQVRQARMRSNTDLLLYSVSILLLLVPFAAATWLALIVLAMQISRFSGVAMRSHAAMICLAWLGMTELGMLLMTKFKFSLTPLLILDAELVRLSLLPFVESVIREDNLLMVGNYSGVILWGCTGVRSACLLVIAYRLALLLTNAPRSFTYQQGLLLMLASFLVNHIRLTLSAHSQACYEMTHTPAGMMLFDSLQILLLMAFLLHANRPQTERQT